MADRPPGYEQAVEDHVCYNCGMKGHMFFACPEDTRRVPAGLEASRKRQASGNDYHVQTKRSKGPVVTHYPPPPPLGLPQIPPPPITYSPRPGYEAFHSGPPQGPPTGPPYHQPPHPGHYDQYPPPPPNAGRSASRGFPYGGSRDVHEHHFQGPPRVPPPETPYRPPHYDQYEQHRPGPPPTTPYGRPYSAPDRYDEQPAGLPQGPPYSTTHRAPHQAHFEHYPPAPGVDSYYAGPPQVYPPPPTNISRNSSHYGYDGASPVRVHTLGHGSSPPGTYSYQSHQYPSSDSPPYHTRYDDRFADRPSYEPQRRDPHPHHPERRPGENQQNRERHGRRMRYDSPKGRSRSERRFPDQRARLASPLNSTPPAQSAKDPTSLEGSKLQRELSDAVLVNMKNTEKYTVEDFSWEAEMIFNELPVKITKDLIREPLPLEWTDDPIMPPKYDKETIASRYINPTNVDDFALSVRETKAWQVMQFHPAFLAPTDVRIEKLWEYERALDPGPAYNKQSRHSVNSSSGGRQRGKSWVSRTRGGRQVRYPQYHGQNHSPSEDQLDSFQPSLTKRIWDQASYRGTEENEGENEGFGKKAKMSSPEPGEVCESDDQEPTATNKSASPSWEEECRPIHQNYQNRSKNSLHDSRIGLLGVISESDPRRLSPQGPATPPPPPSYISGSLSPASSTRSSHGGGSKPPSRRSSRSNPSQPSSRRTSIGSPLTPNERELLGMRPYSSGSDTGRDSPTPQINGAPTRQRQRPAKLDAAYQRRW
ncbi:hypothetical protein F4823DRAFT_534413 [Ustulina deusta]|nr:hypothetical protein F4823DRAFT_534413 [Ustulina deusta]